MWLEAYTLVTMIGALLSFFLACHKNLNVAAYAVAGLLLPIPTVIAAVIDPARDPALTAAADRRASGSASSDRARSRRTGS